MRLKNLALICAVVPLGGCALRSDVNRLELQLAQSRMERARADSANTANLGAIARMIQSLYDSLAAQTDVVTRLRGDTRIELYNIEQQLVAIQELTGQSQQRLTELRGQMDERFQALLAAPQQAQGQANPPGAQPGAPAQPGQGQPTPGQANPPAGGNAAAPAPVDAAPPADQLIEMSIAQLRRGSPATARLGLQEFLRRYPANPRAVDAQYFTGEAWAADHNLDSAAAAYRAVVTQYPTAPRAATAAYKLGLLAAQAGQRDSARTWFNRVVSQFPNSEEAALARDQLRQLAQPAPAAPAQPAPARPRPKRP